MATTTGITECFVIVQQLMIVNLVLQIIPSGILVQDIDYQNEALELIAYT